MNKIETSNGVYQYQYVHLFLGRKYINIEHSKENLLLLKKLLDSHKLEFGIIFGTLLGAIREGNFIKHDEDTDVFILEEDKESLLSLLFELRDIGFEVARYDRNLISIIRNNEYIDIYFFRKKFYSKRVCGNYVLSANSIEVYGEIKFLGKMFNTPKNPIFFLEEFYGKDWKIPKKNANAKYNYDRKIKVFLKKTFPSFIIRFLKRQRK